MDQKYLKMLKTMQEKPRYNEPREWSVYILRCCDGSLYTGIAKDVESRLKQHGLGRGAVYTRTHRPLQILHRESNLTRSEALVREAKIKALPKSKKEKMAGNK
jgi:putative endonuclease